MIIKKVLPAIILIFSIIIFVFSQVKYDANTNLFLRKDKHLMIPSAKTLKIASFGNVNFVADLMYIWSIQFFSTVSIKNKFDYAFQVFDIITDLNPKFEAPYFIGSTILGEYAQDYKNGIALLQKGKKNIKDNYYFDFDSGFYAWYKLRDPKLAKKYYKQMTEYEKLPDMLRDFWLNMEMEVANKVVNKSKAFAIWQEIEKKADSKRKKEPAKAHLLQLKYEMDKSKFDELIKIFTNKYNRFPYSLNELKMKLKIKTIPLDYIGNKYKYNPKNGKISLRMEESWKKFL